MVKLAGGQAIPQICCRLAAGILLLMKFLPKWTQIIDLLPEMILTANIMKQPL